MMILIAAIHSCIDLALQQEFIMITIVHIYSLFGVMTVVNTKDDNNRGYSFFYSIGVFMMIPAAS